MNTLALTVAIACAGASIGLAAWFWLAVSSAGNDWRTLAGVEGLPFDR